MLLIQSSFITFIACYKKQGAAGDLPYPTPPQVYFGQKETCHQDMPYSSRELYFRCLSDRHTKVSVITISVRMGRHIVINE